MIKPAEATQSNIDAKTDVNWRWAALISASVGIGLRLWQYIANPSIWVDEAALARNVLERNLAGLFKPLDFGQVAPPGFLLATKASSALFGHSEYALRLTPFIFGLMGVALFFIVAESVLPRVAAFVATFMFATAIPLVFFSSNLKPYSADVTVTLAIIAAALSLVRRTALTGQLIFVLALLSIVVLFFSQAAVFSLTASGAVIFLSAVVHNRQDKWRRLLLVSCWAVAVIVAVAYGYRSMTAVDNVYMHHFWGQWFMPTAPAKAGKWLWTTAQAIVAGPSRPFAFDGSLHYAAPAVFASLFVLGAVAMLYFERERGLLVVGPVLLTLAASAMRAYPVGVRVSLFLVPLLLLVAVYGIDAVARKLLPQRVAQFACLLLLPFAALTCLRQLPPRRPEHLRPVMQYVADHWHEGDSLWVYYGAGQAFEYYKRLIPIAGEVQVGDCNREDPREYLRQVDGERGRGRVWVLFAHGSASFRFDERGLLLAYLDTIGNRLDAFHAPADDASPTVATVLLYDLSNPQQLATTSAERFALSEKYTPQRWSCYGTMSAIQDRSQAATKAVMMLDFK